MPRRFPHPGDLLAIILLIAWAAFMGARIRYGLDLTDEGIYLATTDRLLRGDAPFLDNRENPVRQFDVLMAAIFAPAGPVSLIALRSLGAAFWLAQMLALWLVVRRWQGAWVAALTACLVPALPLYGIWTPGYNEWSCAFTVFTGAALALAAGTNSPRAALLGGGAAGLALGIDILVYLPLAALVVVPLAMIVCGRAHGSWRHPWVLSGIATLACVAAVIALDATWIIASGLGGAWKNATADMVHQQNHAIPFLTRLKVCWDGLDDIPGQFLVTIAAFAALRWYLAPLAARVSHALVPWAAGAVLAAVLAYNLYPAWDAYLHYHDPANGLPSWYTVSYWTVPVWFAEPVIGIAGFLVFIAPEALRETWHGRVDAATGMLPAFAVFILFVGIAAMSSSLSTVNGLHIRAALAVLGVAGIAAGIRRFPPAHVRPLAGAAIATQVVFAAVLAAAGWHLLFKQAPPSTCTATFTRGPLAGVHATPTQVASIESLQAWVDAHEPATARLIAYHNLPGITFALGRRPVLDWTWTVPMWSWNSLADSTAFNQGLIDRMQAKGLAPDFCVRDCKTGAWPEAYRLNDPVHAYVDTHFRSVWRGWPYEVLLPRDATSPPVEPPVIADALDPGLLPPPDGPQGRFLLPVGTHASRAADGALVLTQDPAAPSPVFAVLITHGTDPVALRLRIESQSPGFYVVLMSDQQFGEIPGGADRAGPGWDVTFPAGPAIDRGFALVRDRRAAPGSHFAFHHLTLAAFPAPSP